MIKIKRAKEIVINTLNEVGVLAEISQIISAEGIDIQALSCRVEGIKAVVNIITGDNSTAFKALKDKKFEPFELDVVAIDVPNKAGMTKRISGELNKHKINIGYLYATALKDQDRCLVVASTSDIDKTIDVLSKLK